MLRKLWLLNALCISIVISPCVDAQEYVPPPMFGGAQKQVEVKEPAPNPKAKAEPTETITRADVLPRGLEPSQGEATPPRPSVKPQTKTAKSDEPEPTQVEIINIAKPKKNAGVVTGPKTMPAVPAKDFESEKTFEEAEEKTVEEKTILERHTEQEQAAQTKKLQPIEAVTSDGIELNVYELEGGNSLKVVIPYTQGISDAAEGVLGTVQRQALKIFENLGENARVQIMSYALPYDTGLSSDRRMSLTRALEVREAFLNAGIEARRIDVRALGQNTDEGQKDRIDLIFYTDKAPL